MIDGEMIHFVIVGNPMEFVWFTHEETIDILCP